MTVNPDISPIFVVGTGRSGTTLLRMMLNAHSNIYLTHEASFYLVPINKKQACDWFDLYRLTYAFNLLKIDPDEIFKELSCGDAQLRKADAFKALMRCKARQYGKTRYGDKTPMNSMHLKKIFTDFQDPKVIHIVRDPRSTVASLMRMPWAAGSIGMNSHYCDMQLRKLEPYVDRILEIRLEDLIADPEHVMKKTLSYVGEPWEEQVLNYSELSPTDDLPPFPWFANAKKKLIKKDVIPGWMKMFSPEWIRIIEKMNKHCMEKFNYTPAVFEEEPGFFKSFKTRLGEIPDVLATYYRIMKFVIHLKPVPGKSPNKAANALLQLNPDAWKNYPEFAMPDDMKPE